MSLLDLLSPFRCISRAMRHYLEHMFAGMRRAINRRQQGDLGEASAIEWFTSKGALVLLPFGHSPDYDLVAQINNRLLRIQVKTTTQEMRTPNGHVRFPVSLATTGGNQSWNGVIKTVDPESIDYLFVLTGSGRRWLIPSTALASRRTIRLGGPSYAGNEIEPGTEITKVVFGRMAPLDLPVAGGVPKRSNGLGCKPSGSVPSQVRILPPPLASSRPIKPTNYERKPGQRSEAIINQKRRITIPQRPFFEAGFANGGRVRVRADGLGRILIEQIELPEWARDPAGAERGAPS
jgi:PD-(D/E)XK endonuclease